MIAHEALFRRSDYLPEVRKSNLTLAVTGDQILGSAGRCVHDKQTARVRKVFVRPDQAGQGLGRMLVDRVEGEIRRAGFREVFLRASLNAVPFYERLGYRRIRQERIELVRGGISAGLMIMQKILG